jgi:hypothetical protein
MKTLLRKLKLSLIVLSLLISSGKTLAGSLVDIRPDFEDDPKSYNSLSVDELQKIHIIALQNIQCHEDLAKTVTPDTNWSYVVMAGLLGVLLGGGLVAYSVSK